jgi:hypothetical protein
VSKTKGISSCKNQRIVVSPVQKQFHDPDRGGCLNGLSRQRTLSCGSLKNLFYSMDPCYNTDTETTLLQHKLQIVTGSQIQNEFSL